MHNNSATYSSDTQWIHVVLSPFVQGLHVQVQWQHHLAARKKTSQ